MPTPEPLRRAFIAPRSANHMLVRISRAPREKSTLEVVRQADRPERFPFRLPVEFLSAIDVGVTDFPAVTNQGQAGFEVAHEGVFIDAVAVPRNVPVQKGVVQQRAPFDAREEISA